MLTTFVTKANLLLSSWFTGRIKNKILLSVLSIFVVLYGATLTYVYYRIKADLLESARIEAVSTSQILAHSLYRNYEIENDIRSIQIDVLSAKKDKGNILEINVINRDLKVVSSTNEDNLFDRFDSQTYVDAIDNRSSVLVIEAGNEPFINVVYPVSAGLTEKNFATGAIEIKTDLKSQFENLQRIQINTVFAGIIIIIAIVVVINAISKSITRPIQMLYSGMGVANEGDLDVKVPVVSKDEVGYLTSSFNSMIGSIKESNQQLKENAENLAALNAKLMEMMKSSTRFVPDQFLQSLGKNDITDVQLGDATLKSMTVFFMDIRNFTSMSEKMNAQDNLIFLNSLLESILPTIERNRGFIDKYVGDAIMALFPYRPDDAVLAAVGMREQLAIFNEGRGSRGDAAVDLGIGINSGELILGTIGSPNRIDTTVIGNTVNVASRMESLTKTYNVPIVLPEQVFNDLEPATRRDLAVRDLGPAKIKGIDREVRLTGVIC